MRGLLGRGGAAVADQQQVALAAARLMQGEAEVAGNGRQRVVLGDMQPGGTMVEGAAERRAVGKGPAAHPCPGFQHDAASPQLGQPARGGDAGGTGADHRHIGIHVHQRVRKRATSPRSGSTASRPWRSSRRRCASVSPTVKPIWPISSVARGNRIWAAS